MTTKVYTTEAAFLLNISTGRLRILLQQGRVVGAYKEERLWMIPLNSRGVPEIIPGSRGPQGTWNKAERTGNTFVHVLRNTIDYNRLTAEECQKLYPVVAVLKELGTRLNVQGINLFMFCEILLTITEITELLIQQLP